MKKLVFKVRIEERPGVFVPTPRSLLMRIRFAICRSIQDGVPFSNTAQAVRLNAVVQEMVNIDMEVENG